MASIPLDDIFKGILKLEDIDDIGEITLLREEDFEEGCQELFEKCEACLKSTIRESGLSKRDINKVVLVGGSSKIPKIKEIIKDYFRNENILGNKEFDSLTAVAKGAAIYAAKHCDYSKVPVKQTITLPLNGDAKQLPINIYQGESEYIESPDMELIIRLVLNNTSQYPDPTYFLFTFEFNDKGILEVSIKDLNNEFNKTNVVIDMKNIGYNEEIERYQKKIQEIMPINFGLGFDTHLL
ncbi:Uncharacterized protein QTN25_005057 [Entamoeba marina]